MTQTAEKQGDVKVGVDLGKDKASIVDHLLAPIYWWSFESRLGHRFPLYVTKAIKGKEHLTPFEKDVITQVATTDWSKESLNLDKDEDLELAAQAAKLGAVICYGFGNFYAVAAHPHEAAVRYVNKSKGRPEDQVGSLTTTRENMPFVFDWSKVPGAITQDNMLGIMNEFYKAGPFGFRGPSVSGLEKLLISRDGDRLTTQVIAPGYDCRSNILLARFLELIGKPYAFITSANISHNVTGTTEEPAHYKMEGIQKDFGKKPGYIMVAHADENAARVNYPDHEPMSTSILAFHKITYDERHNPILYLERDGSLAFGLIAKNLKKHGFGLTRGPKASSRLPVRTY